MKEPQPYWWKESNDYFTFVGPPDYTTEGKGSVVWQIAGKPAVFPARPFWKHGQERGAWRYELARRVNKQCQLPAWPELTWAEQSFVTRTLGATDSPIVSSDAPSVLPGRNPPPAREGFSDFLNVQWNLKLTTAALVKDFEARIQEQREKHGIAEPKGMQGRTTRPVSWHWPELMDATRPLNASDRSTLTKARNAASHALEDLRRTLASVPHAELKAFPSLRLLVRK